MLTVNDQLLYNPFDPALRANPYPIYRTLRREDPVHRSPLGFWAVSRYADVVQLQRDASLDFYSPVMYRRLKEAMTDPTSPTSKIARWLQFTERAAHRRFRGLMGPYFTPRAAAELRPLIEGKVQELFDALPEGEPVDFIEGFAKPLPINMLCGWLGLEPEHYDRCRQWAESIGRVLITVLNPEVIRRMGEAVLASDAFFREQLAIRRADPRDDLLTRFMDAEYDGLRITEDELVANLILLLGATYETTRNMLGNSLLTLLRNPDQFALLYAQGMVDRNAVDELLRFESPSQLQGRYTPHDLEVAGHTIPAGSRITLLIGSGNRDEEQYDRPDVLDLGRPDPRPLSFGGGPHHCLGAWISRIEVEAALTMLVRQYPTIRLAASEPFPWRPEPAARALAALPVTLSTR